MFFYMLLCECNSEYKRCVVNKIREKRLEIGFNQEKLAIEIGVDRTTVTKWETGRTNPRAELLPKLAKILNCSIDELLSEPEEKK